MSRASALDHDQLIRRCVNFLNLHWMGASMSREKGSRNLEMIVGLRYNSSHEVDMSQTADLMHADRLGTDRLPRSPGEDILEEPETAICRGKAYLSVGLGRPPPVPRSIPSFIICSKNKDCHSPVTRSF